MVPFCFLSKLYFTFFLITGNAIFDDVFHAVLFQSGSILLVLNLCESFVAGGIQISVIRVFQFNHNAEALFWYLNQNITVTGSGFRIGFYDPVFFKPEQTQEIPW